MRVRSLGSEDHLKKEIATCFSILAWEIPQTEEPGRLQSMGSQRDMAKQLNNNSNYLMSNQSQPIHIHFQICSLYNSTGKFNLYFRGRTQDRGTLRNLNRYTNLSCPFLLSCHSCFLRHGFSLLYNFHYSEFDGLLISLNSNQK